MTIWSARIFDLRRGFSSIAIAACITASGCALPKGDEDGDLGGLGDLEVDTGELDPETAAAVEAQIMSVLRALFPDLSEEELVEIRGSFSLDAVLELRDELEAVRKEAIAFSEDLFKSAEERVADREQDLAEHNDGFPTGLEAVGHVCTYDEASEHARVTLSGVFDGKQGVQLDDSSVKVTIDGQAQAFTLQCLPDGTTVDIVFLIDITGSMSNVIHSVRDSVVDFVDLIEQSGLRGTVSVVTFQDTVGVNRTFQQSAPSRSFERSPFFRPVSIGDGAKVSALRSFVNRLEANRGADAPENLAGAIDFARNNVIGDMSNGEPNVIGDRREDPPDTEAFPKLTSERQVFVVLTDVSFHGDDRDEQNSSLEPEFVPRAAADILATLQKTGTTVHVSDPSWADTSLSPAKPSVDADYWAIHTGGVGKDLVAGYSLVDLELVVVAEETGLLDITLDQILASSCTLELDAAIGAAAEVAVQLDVGGKQFSTPLVVERY